MVLHPRYFWKSYFLRKNMFATGGRCKVELICIHIYIYEYSCIFHIFMYIHIFIYIYYFLCIYIYLYISILKEKAYYSCRGNSGTIRPHILRRQRTRKAFQKPFGKMWAPKWPQTVDSSKRRHDRKDGRQYRPHATCPIYSRSISG